MIHFASLKIEKLFSIHYLHFFLIFCVIQNAWERPWLSSYHHWLRITCSSPRWIRISPGTFMWGSYSGSLRKIGSSTQVPARAWNNTYSDTLVLPSPTTKSWKRCRMTVTMSIRLNPFPHTAILQQTTFR